MKTKYLITLITLAFVGLTQAATLTIDVPAADVPRLQEAFGSILGLPQPATQTQIETAIKQWLIGSTKDYERRKNMTAYTPPPFSTEPSPTPGGLKAAPEKAAPKPTAKPKK